MKTKRVCITVLFVALLCLGAARVETQDVYTVYMPVVHSPERTDVMSNWDVIVPVEATNLITNPSIETNTTGWSAGGINTVAQTAAQSKFGSYDLLCTYQNNDTLASYALTLTAAAYTFSTWIYIPTAYDGTDVTLNAVNYAGATGTISDSADMSITNTWQRLNLTFTPVGGDLVGNFQVRESGAAPTAGRVIHTDAMNAVLASEVSTHVDGDQDGCEWNGAAHASTSTRSALSRAGGYIRDLSTDYSFDVSQYIGSGMAPTEQIVDNYAILPGGQVQGHKTQTRSFTLMGMIRASSSTDLHSKRAALIGIFEPAGIPNDQAFILRYGGATVDKEIFAYYEAGLSLGLQAANCYNERFALRFLAVDPFWYQLGESSDALDTNDTATFYQQTARLRSTGQWDDLGLTGAPTTSDITEVVFRASDGTVYYGGAWTVHDGVAGRNYAARYDPATDTWSSINGAAIFNGTVSAIVEGPDGTIYFGGNFTDAGGLTGDYICQYDPATDTVSPLAGAGSGAVRALAFGNDGLLYLGGSFVAFGGVGGADYVASWNGAAFAAVSTGMNNVVNTLKKAPNGDIYAGGPFTTAGGAGRAYIASWDGTSWNVVADDSLNSEVRSIDISLDGIVYAGGLFTDASSNSSADKIAFTRGQFWEAMSTGANNTVWKLKIGPDGMVYASGQFTQIGEFDPVEYAARWNGSTWAKLDINFPGTPVLYCFDVGPSDPVIVSNYDLWTAYSDTAAATFYAGSTTVTHDGTANAQPTITVNRSGGTSATLVSIRNETTGKELLFDYAMLDGETLTINLESTQQSVVSDFFGSRPDAILKASDVGSFELIPGDNNITAFVDVAGAPTITTFLIHESTFWSLD